MYDYGKKLAPKQGSFLPLHEALDLDSCVAYHKGRIPAYAQLAKAEASKDDVSNRERVCQKSMHQNHYSFAQIAEMTRTTAR